LDLRQGGKGLTTQEMEKPNYKLWHCKSMKRTITKYRSFYGYRNTKVGLDVSVV
jgi:hypothetical protein